MSTTVIEARGLIKTYKGNNVVNGIDLTVEQREVLGLLGPNGAGKTTTILMLMGLTEASAGSVRVLGKDPLREPLAVKRAVGYLPDAVGFYDTLTARENLAFSARLAGFANADAAGRIERALERVRLDGVADRRVDTFSRGMRQRLGLAELLMRDCQIMILDEPTSGLDPQSTQELLGFIAEFAGEGRTVLVSSHLLDVVQTVCTRVALFNKGRIGFVGTPAELAARVGGGAFEIDLEAEDFDAAARLSDLDGVDAVIGGDRQWRISASHDLRPEIAARVVEDGGRLVMLDAHRIDLGEAYDRYFRESSHAA
ncbi:ABC transporter ATP-binding protein [Pelagibacterium halotolerans]|uniref:ABC transporter ATP-binding protein n=1 Tax=Pelagibacterium halotolerans TaxID=531813 RepID=UPI00384DD2D0